MTEWHYLSNQMEVSTRGNYKKALVIENYETAGLITQVTLNPALGPLITRRDPLALAFREAYTAWSASGGIHEGQSLTLDQRLTLATKQLNTIDLGIQLTPGYEKGTPAYKTLFVDGHYSFNAGGIETRIAAWDTFQSNMGTVVALAGFKTQAIAIHTDLQSIRTGQSGSIGNTGTLSGNLETARINLANMDYRNLGFCMDNFFGNNALMLALFDTNTIREHLQLIFTGHLIGAEMEGIMKHGFLSSDIFTAESNGAADIGLYLASTVHGTDSAMVKIDANTSNPVNISQFGAIDLNIHRFLNVVDLSPTLGTQYIIHL
jgi:hypothetical protein